MLSIGKRKFRELRLAIIFVHVHVYEKSLYPSSSFWKTYHHLLKDTNGPSHSISPVENRLRLLRNNSFDSLVIECGEIDGIVSDTWMNINENSSALEVDEDDAHVGYWAAAAIWFDAWEQITVDRVSYCMLVLIFIFVYEFQ